MYGLFASAVLKNCFFGLDKGRAFRATPIIFFAMLGFIMAPQFAQAGKVEIHGNDARQRITVSAENASLKDVLKYSSQTFDFEVRGLSKLGAAPPMTVTFSGSLKKVLARLLRNRNYLIVGSTTNQCGIRKVSILDENYGSLPRSRAGRKGKSKELGTRLKDRIRAITQRAPY